MENLYIQSTLTAQQAFEAMQAGKNVVCKVFGNTYDTLDNFPATVFFKPDYEFALALQTMALNGITFTAPLTLAELEENQDLFIVGPSSIKKAKFQSQIEVLTAVKNGFAQRDEENAISHLKAICLSFGVTDPSLIIENVFTTAAAAPKPKRTTKKAEKTRFEEISTKINACESVQNVKDVRTDFRANAELTEREHELLETHCAQKIAEFDAPVEEKEPTEAEYYAEPELVVQETESVDDGLDEMIPVPNVEQNKSYDEILNLIKVANNETDLENAENKITASKGILSGDDLHDLDLNLERCRKKLLTQQAEIIPAISKFDEIKALVQVASSDADLNRASSAILANARHLSSDDLDTLQAEHMAREELLKNQTDLIHRASTAPNATEANALITYTKTWDEVDRKPVLDAINARLLVLSKPQLEQQSLAVRIQNAESFEDLDNLRAEVEDRDPLIQERLFGLIKDRELSLTF